MEPIWHIITPVHVNTNATRAGVHEKFALQPVNPTFSWLLGAGSSLRMYQRDKDQTSEVPERTTSQLQKSQLEHDLRFGIARVADSQLWVYHGNGGLSSRRTAFGDSRRKTPRADREGFHSMSYASHIRARNTPNVFEVGGSRLKRDHT